MEQNTQLAPYNTAENQQIAEQKAKNWHGFGYGLAMTEMELNYLVGAPPQKPNAIADIPAAESELARLRGLEKIISEKRKERTNVLDSLKERLMQPEKTVAFYHQQLAASLLPIKKLAEEQQAAQAAQANAINAFREAVMNEYNAFIAQCYAFINERVQQAYELALSTPGVAVADHQRFVDERIAKIKGKFNLPQFKETDPAKLAIIQEVFGKFDGGFFEAEYTKAIIDRFKDYTIAKQNAADALARSQAEAANKVQQIQEQQQQNDAAAGLQVAATAAPAANIVGKAIKRSYVVDMDAMGDNQGAMLAVVKAFTANNLWSTVRVKSLWKLDFSQMAAALGKKKSEDNNFAPEGITFKEREKI